MNTPNPTLQEFPSAAETSPQHETQTIAAGSKTMERGGESPLPAVTRYFTDDCSVWKFEPGKPPLCRLANTSEWMDSIFTGIEEFMADSGLFWEIAEEEGEA